ncbi:MAG: phenylacetate-CoA oxygenase subunit PaaJ [Chlorobi bacterium]|nr:phenylacetate-CoA oxygenase subunit PaaJ [Chlorobiota bacterium]
MLTHEMVYAALEDVHDPEIPVLSIVDMGIVTDVTISDSRVAVTITPTFVGCPALDAIRTAIAHRLSALSIANVEVIVDYATPWSSNRLSERGRQALAEIGFAPPPRFEGEFEPDILLNAQCPYCGSSHTVLRSPFGPALCRAIYYCNDCHQAFEQFKAIG